MFTKFTLSVASLMLLITLTACGAKDTSSSTEKSSSGGAEMSEDVKIQLDASADGTTQILGLNEVMAIRLESNPSTGYGWFATSSNPDVITQLGEAQYNEPSSSSAGTTVGAPGTETLYFKSASTGTATLTLNYKRGWETESKPEKTITIIVEVK